MYAFSALHEAIMSFGCAACPVEETTYGDFCSPEEDAGGPVDDGGRVEGRLLYVYGKVVAEGKDTNGETVNGTCANNRCGPKSYQHSFDTFPRSAYDCRAYLKVIGEELTKMDGAFWI
jgi:hypothetical protein